MPRLPRILLPQSYYHIIARGNNKHQIFNVSDDYQYYLDLIIKYKPDHPFDLYHYCLMPNHIHLLIQTSLTPQFSTFMKRLNLAYYHHFRIKYGWVGYFWQGRFKSQAIGKDSYFIQAGKYIELNPVRANLAQCPSDYVWSSYRYYAKGSSNKLITNDLFYEGLGSNPAKRQIAYRKLFIDELVLQSYDKNVWGSPTQRYREHLKIVRKLKKQNV